MVDDSSAAACFKISEVFSKFWLIFENYDLPECICNLFLSDECVDDFGARHATARRDTRPFDLCITGGETQAPRLYERIQGELSVPIYILALTLSRVHSVKVYSRHYIQSIQCSSSTGQAICNLPYFYHSSPFPPYHHKDFNLPTCWCPVISVHMQYITSIIVSTKAQYWASWFFQFLYK